MSRPADARVRARYGAGAKRGGFRGSIGAEVGRFFITIFGLPARDGKVKHGIRPSGGDLCSFRQVAGRSVQDCGKVVQKLAQREDENHKLCTTLCAPLRLGTRIVQVSFPLGVWSVGVVVRRCAIRSFFLPPAETGFPFRRRGRGGRQAGAGRAHGPWRGWPSALPPLRTVIRHTSGVVRHASGIARHTSGMVRHASGIVRHCTRVRPPLSSALPPPCARRRGTRCHNGARANPIYIARANPILYIRVHSREGENVLHRAASNDVDNFSVDNPLWITTAAGGRLLRGRRRRRCGGSVNAGTKVQTRTGRVRKASRAMGARRSVFRPHGRDFTAWTGRTYI